MGRAKKEEMRGVGFTSIPSGKKNEFFDMKGYADPGEAGEKEAFGGTALAKGNKPFHPQYKSGISLRKK